MRIRNIRKTRRHFDIPRSLFYVWRAAFERGGEAGLVTTRPVARSPPRTTRPEGHCQVNESGTYEGGRIRDQAAVTWAHTVNDRARNIR